MDIVVATSIAPKNIELQKLAIKSWLDLGISVVSLNTNQEIEYLTPFFREIEFLKVEHTGKNMYGKDYVYLNDIMNYLKKYGTDICGLINSDIFLRTTPHFLNLILLECKNSLVFASRWDLNQLTDEHGELFELGFDVFFFDRNLLSYFQTSRFCLGVPWWDYWIPATAVQNHLTIKYAVTPFAYHLKHDTNYDQHIWIRAGMKFLKDYDSNAYESLSRQIMNTQLAKMNPIISNTLKCISFRLLSEVENSAIKVF
ncbi:hypothetical protein H6G51_03040 [Limnothrix sp. FACHB-708]|uniref:hypothetical protein n=1 Tax=unclassified Limnothrix TaxID=2632864 RepID=UPI001687E6A9|nr:MULTISPECIES: hypothetical protein [unclassified Limnothrix]MBD2552245.1 hypothetical protein [Limnothrix sp. FACHB-708]MBD2590112.1 hypothetical protein [Limnothrix sp. FACHB-406]